MNSQAVETRRLRAPAFRSISEGVLLLICVAATGGIFAADSVVQHMNLGVLYLIPLAMYCQVGRKRGVVALTVLMIGCCYTGYFLKPKDVDPSAWVDLISMRMMNRNLIALTMTLMAFHATVVVSLRRDMKRVMSAAGSGAAQDEFNVLLRSFDLITWGLVSGVLMALIVLVDILTTSSVNMGIMYMLPVIVGVWTGSRRTVAALVAVSLGLSALGYWLGPGPLSFSTPLILIVNRVLAGGAVVVVGLMGCWWIGAKRE